jgi:hypothetical protein
MSRVQFSESVLESRYRFERYLAGEDAIARICEESKKPYVPSECKLSAFNVAWIVLTPFNIYYSLFLNAIGSFLYYFTSQHKLALNFYVQAARIDSYESMIFSNYIFGTYNNILVDWMNTYSQDAEEIYTHERIKLDNPDFDPSVVSYFHSGFVKDNHLVFGDLDGQCDGISHWFAHLYFRTQTMFTNPEHHLVSVAKQFSDGAGREAALMQLAQNSYHRPILGLTQWQSNKLESPTAEKVRELFESLKPGLYSVVTVRKEGSKCGHRMNFAVTKDHTYLLDPNYGLIKETPENLSEPLSSNFSIKLYEILG